VEAEAGGCLEQPQNILVQLGQVGKDIMEELEMTHPSTTELVAGDLLPVEQEHQRMPVQVAQGQTIPLLVLWFVMPEVAVAVQTQVLEEPQRAGVEPEETQIMPE
jgi:hypothetical protein